MQASRLELLYARLYLAAVYAQPDRLDEAKSETAEASRVSPDFSVLRLAQRLPLRDAAALARLVDGMRKAGLPECGALLTDQNCRSRLIA